MSKIQAASHSSLHLSDQIKASTRQAGESAASSTGLTVLAQRGAPDLVHAQPASMLCPCAQGHCSHLQTPRFFSVEPAWQPALAVTARDGLPPVAFGPREGLARALCLLSGSVLEFPTFTCFSSSQHTSHPAAQFLFRYKSASLFVSAQSCFTARQH